MDWWEPSRSFLIEESFIWITRKGSVIKCTEFSKYYTSIDDIYGIDPLDKEKILEVSKWFSFRASDNYLSLIDWDDAADPIRRLIIPSPEELREWGDLNPSSEDLYPVTPSLQHKYRETALLQISEMCGGLQVLFS